MTHGGPNESPSLRPSAEQGTSWLVVGGTAVERRAAASAHLGDVVSDAAHPVLVVRVGAMPNGEGSLEDAITAGAEAALRGIGAPGGLYDQADCALPALGSWLFRARSRGHGGLVVVLDEVDAWLEVRGHVSAPPAVATVDALLRATRDRSVSVLATVRAADAAGVPALANEIASQFAQRTVLGGAATVARDPSSLVGALAGRSFTLGAVRQALAGWLDLAQHDDDTVVHFSSPFGPPHVGMLATEPTVDWPDRAPAPSVTETPRTPEAPLLGPGWADALRAAMDVRDALRPAREVLDGPRGFRQIERAFRAGVVRLPMALAALARGERALGIEPTRLRGAGTETLARFEQMFRDDYPAAFDGWLAGGNRPAMLCDLPARLAKLAAERGARGTSLVVFTGLRADVYARMKSRVFPRVPGLTFLEEGVHWAARPTTPSMQRELVARGLEALPARLPPRDEPAAPRSLAEALTPRREHLGRHEILRIDAYATVMARGDASLDDLVTPLEAALPGVLLALCGSFVGRTLIAVAGDVGMHPASTDATLGLHGPFSHGGDSPFEAIVPFAILQWGETARR